MSTILHNDMSSNRYLQHCTYCFLAIAHMTNSKLDSLISYYFMWQTFHIHGTFNIQRSTYKGAFTLRDLPILLKGGIFARNLTFLHIAFSFRFSFEVLIDVTKHSHILHASKISMVQMMAKLLPAQARTSLVEHSLK